MATLVLDIEIVAEDLESLDDVTKSDVMRRVTAEPGTAEYNQQLKEVQQKIIFSPLTGQIVAIGMLDVDKDRGVVYFQAPGSDIKEFKENNFTYKPMTERQILESFWGGAEQYNEFVTFNGRGFDIPYINARSAVRKVPVRVDLMSNRYLNKSWGGALHIDLYDQLSYYGAVRSAGSLHLWTRALDIPSPKEGEVNAGDVGKSFREGKYVEIAQYNARDVVATKELYLKWRQYIRV